jgi:hypothetical protein
MMLVGDVDVEEFESGPVVANASLSAMSASLMVVGPFLVAVDESLWDSVDVPPVSVGSATATAPELLQTRSPTESAQAPAAARKCVVSMISSSRRARTGELLTLLSHRPAQTY